jgi:UDP-glucose 4-epimerase
MDFRGTSCLVTGGAGFIGSNLAIRLVELGAKVTVLDSMVPGCGGNLFNLAPVMDKVSLMTADQRDADTMKRMVTGQSYIFNLAGNVSHQDSMKTPLEDMRLNVEAQIQLLEACRAHNKHAVIVHSSTRQIYGTPKYLPVDEQHPVHPIDVNGINKYAGEQYHTLYSRVHGLKTVALRLTNTYGPRQLIKHSRQGVIGWFANRAVLGETIKLFGTGEQLRDFNYVDDCVEAMLLSAQAPDCQGRVFNLSGEKSSLAHVAELLVAASKRGKLERVEFPPDAKKIEIGDFYGTSESLRGACGWAPKTPLAEGLAKMVRYYEQHKEHYLDA